MRPWREAWILLAAPTGAHALLIASWWAAFRWLNITLPPWPAVALAWLTSLALASQSARAGTRKRVPPALLWLRVPAALFFFILLALHGRSDPALVLYALAFAPPYLSILSLGPSRKPLPPPPA